MTKCSENCDDCDGNADTCTECAAGKTPEGTRCRSEKFVVYNVTYGDEFADFKREGKSTDVDDKIKEASMHNLRS